MGYIIQVCVILQAGTVPQGSCCHEFKVLGMKDVHNVDIPPVQRLREQLFHAGALSSSFMHTESGNLCAGSSNLQWSDSAVESIAEDALEEGQHPELLQQRLLQGEASDTSDDEWNSNFAQGVNAAEAVPALPVCND